VKLKLKSDETELRSILLSMTQARWYVHVELIQVQRAWSSKFYIPPPKSRELIVTYTPHPWQNVFPAICGCVHTGSVALLHVWNWHTYAGAACDPVTWRRMSWDIG
jgi:hypothetical protein